MALTYPLSPVPLSLSHPDGTRRKTMKNSLMSVVNSCYDTNLDLPSHLVHNLIERLPKNYKRIATVADTYRENSLKNNERNLEEFQIK